jgi:hypothetical protein
MYERFSEPPHKSPPRTREAGPDDDAIAIHEEEGEPFEQSPDPSQFEKS